MQKEAEKINNSEERHEHSGKSSKGTLYPEEILAETGLKRGDTFLDAGCGEGHFSMAASEIVGDEGRVYAVDIYEEAITALRREIHEKNNNIEPLIADITKRIPVEDGSVDVCLMADILHGFVANKEVEDSLREIAGVLKEGGILAVVDFRKIEGPPGPPVSIRLTPEEVEDVVAPYGFKSEKVIEAGPFHYAVIFRK